MLSLSYSCVYVQVPVQSLATSPTAFNSSPLQSSSEHSKTESGSTISNSDGRHSSGNISKSKSTRVGIVVTAAKGNDLHRWCFYPAAPACSSYDDSHNENCSNKKARAATTTTVQATDGLLGEGRGQEGGQGQGRAKKLEWVTLETVENAHEIGVSCSCTSAVVITVTGRVLECL